ncbi:hypothetical protein [Kineococcus radiotolerans]|uniref:Integral membrane protein n=1 Tax=Kineococcus radiotolerans (strain ATCC BAA-149 / DSM 14245 / SRS30216) TaxID=266940 RepID=A6WBQ1_KINRD|nr:hypothetical protein [Kineococcus radiotolerans]ABS04240.1 hypothetical protein Krad_2769 [Kineococcus radiotolerans SRS30216 = ATCC BAA-149]
MSAASGHPSSRPDLLLLALVGLPVVGAVLTLAVQLYLATWGGVDVDVVWVLSTALFCGWGLLPFVAAMLVGISVYRHWRSAAAVAVLGQLLLVIGTGWLLHDVVASESSTAVLGLIFAPLLQGAAAGVVMAGSVGVARMRRHAARTL